jgi:hypothetical protein
MELLELRDPCGWYAQTCDRDEPTCAKRYATWFVSGWNAATGLDKDEAWWCRHLRRWLKATLCGFEETVLRLAAGTIRVRDEARLLRWTSRAFGLFAGLRLGESPAAGAPDHLVVRAVRWRCMVAALARHWLWPSARTGDPHWDDLVLQFELSHLDLVTHVAERQHAEAAVDDTYWLSPTAETEGQHSPLTVYYPLPNRVLTAHELPNLHRLLFDAGLLMDSGKSKDVSHLSHELVRNLIFKLAPRTTLLLLLLMCPPRDLLHSAHSEDAV